MADGISIPFDLGTVEPFDPTKPPITNPPPGAYEGKTVDAGPHISKAGMANGATSPTSYRIAVESEVGTCDFYPGLDFSKEANKRSMATALLSVGMKREKLGAIKEITPEHFLGPKREGRKCYFIVTAVEGLDSQGRPNLNDKKLCTKEQYESYLSAHGGNGAAQPSAAPAAGAKPAAPAASVKALFEDE